MDGTKIEWADDTFNPWWGCVKVSPACENCYAETFAKRTGNAVWGPTAPRRFFGDKHWAQALRWNAQAAASGQPRRVFCSSMADICEDREDLVQSRARLMDLIQETPALTWMLLTKRPENFVRFFDWRERGTHRPLSWPPNVWAMTTVENQEQADRRIAELLKVPATVLGLSCEPLLGPVDLARSVPCGYYCDESAGHADHGPNGNLGRIGWVICGGESGPKARPMRPEWARSLRDQCQETGLAFFFKQWGEHAPRAGCSSTGHAADLMVRVGKKTAGRILDGRTWDEFPGAA